MSRWLMTAVIHGLVFVLAVSHVGAAAIAVGAYRPGLALAGGLLLTVGLALRWGRGPRAAAATAMPGPGRAVARDLVLLLAVAFLFRFAPVPEFAGGRDDGVYANLAAHLVGAGSPRHADPTFVVPPADPRAFLEETRPQSVLRVADGVPEGLEGRLEGLYLPGVYIADADAATYVFQFLHVLPIWMSIVASLAGDLPMGYAVIAFALASVVLFYLLVLAVGVRRRWALAGGLLLAVNPLHAWFAKNSVTEPLALFFNLACLLALAWAWRLRDGGPWRARLVGIAVASFSAFCLTRISGFFFLPFLSLAAIVVVSLARDHQERRLAVAAWLGALAVFALSVLYLQHTSFPYALEQYRKVFAPLLGEEWPRRLPWLIGLAVVAVAVLLAAAGRDGAAGRAIARARGWLGPAAMLVMLAAIALHAVRVHGLATGAVEDHVGYVARYGLAGHGLDSVKHSSLVNLAVYASPFVVGLLGWELFRWRARSPLRTLLLLLLAGYFVYAAVLQWVLPYQFYYGRYLLPAVLPFAVLLIVCSADGSRRQAIRWLAIALAMVWCVWLSASQWRYRVGDTLLPRLEAAFSGVAANDLLLLDRRGLDHTPVTLPLIYTMDRNVWTFRDDAHLEELVARDLAGLGYGTVWVASRRASAPWLEPVRAISFTWRDAEPSPLVPLQARVRPFRCELSRVDLAEAPRPMVLFASRRAREGVTVRGMHDDGVWTGGRLEITFPAPATPPAELVVSVHGWRPAELALTADAVAVTLDGEPLPAAAAARDELRWRIPEGTTVDKDSRLVLSVPTFVPAEVLVDSRDTRHLGLDLVRAELR